MKTLIGFFLLAIIVFLYVDSSRNHSHLPKKVYAIYDKNKVGELAMVNATIKSVKLACPKAEIIVKANAKFNDLSFDNSKTYLIITAGQFGVDLIKSVNKPNNIKILICTHQWFDGMENLHDIFITLPKHSIDDNIQKIAKQNRITLIPTLGVLHTMSRKTLKQQDASGINLHDAKVGFVLAGDAEMPNGKDWSLFTADNARKLAKEIAEFSKKTGYKILITNGPRTGAYINTSTKNLEAHKNGKLDPISSVFIEELQKEGLQSDKDFEFHDFQFGKPSALKAIMALLMKNKGFMIVPGESTSFISETIAVMPAVIYENSAMNKMHHLFLKQITGHKLAYIWTSTPNQSDIESYEPPKSQAINVVKEVLKSNSFG